MRAGRIRFFADGSSRGFFPDAVSVHFPIGNRSYPTGYYVIHALVRVAVAADGDRGFVGGTEHASIEDLCATLA